VERLSRAHADQPPAPVDAAAEPARAKRPHASMTPAAMRQLQRTIGNRAVAGLAQRASLQREVTISAQDLDPLVMREGEKRKGLFAKSSFVNLQKALAKYHAAAQDEKPAALHNLERLCLKWINAHAAGKDPLDRRRRPVVEALLEEIDAELVALARGQAQGIYHANISNALGISDRDPYALKQITGFSQDAAANPLSKGAEKLRNELGLTRPEVAAIQVFTGEDYKYINPTVANSQGWLDDSKARNNLRGTDELYFEEGTLHAGVAMQGLAKIKPWNETVYRGASFTRAKFKVAIGDVLPFNSFASASKLKSKAQDFAYTSSEKSDQERRDGAPDRDVAVIYEFRRPNGRDVTEFSLAQDEEEVVLLPGSRFRVEKLMPITAPPSKFAKTTTIKEWWSAVCVNATPGLDADGSESESASD
jgi:hypothetical protein